MPIIKSLLGSFLIAVSVAVIYLGSGFLFGKNGNFVGPYFYESAHRFRLDTVATIHSIKQVRTKAGYDNVVAYHWENYNGDLCYSSFYNAAQRNWNDEEFNQLNYGDSLPILATTYECHAIIKPSNLEAILNRIINRTLLLSVIAFGVALLFLWPSTGASSLIWKFSKKDNARRFSAN